MTIFLIVLGCLCTTGSLFSMISARRAGNSDAALGWFAALMFSSALLVGDIAKLISN